MLNNIVDYTNANIEHFQLNFREVIEQSDKYTHSEVTDLLKLKAFIGIVYLRVSTKVNLRSGLGNMVPRKFKSLLRHCRGNAFLFLSGFWALRTNVSDTLACIRHIFEGINKRNASKRYPSPFLAEHENLYSYRGHIEIKQ